MHKVKGHVHTMITHSLEHKKLYTGFQFDARFCGFCYFTHTFPHARITTPPHMIKANFYGSER